MLRTIYSLALLLLLALPARLDAQEREDRRPRVELTGRLQVQYNSSSIAREEEFESSTTPFSTFEVRRARLGVRLELSDWILSEIEAEFASRDVALRNAFIDFAFDPGFGVRVGQFKKPFSLLELTSSTVILPIERGLRIRGLSEFLVLDTVSGEVDALLPIFAGDPLLPEEQALLASLGYSGYDVGVEVHGELGRFGYRAGIFNGDGSGAVSESGVHGFAARLTYAPLSGHPLTLGAAVSYQGVSDSVFIDDEVHAIGSGAAFEVDAEWGASRRPGLHLMAEAALGGDRIDDGTFSGVQVIGAVFHPVSNSKIEGLEPLFRISYGNAGHGRAGDAGWLLTPGFNLYFSGRNRFMVNWDLFLPGGDNFRSANALRAQAQVHF